VPVRPAPQDDTVPVKPAAPPASPAVPVAEKTARTASTLPTGTIFATIAVMLLLSSLAVMIYIKSKV